MLTVTTCNGGTVVLSQKDHAYAWPLVNCTKRRLSAEAGQCQDDLQRLTSPGPLGKSGVRLVNLAPDVPKVGLRDNGIILQDNVPYPNGGEHWVDIPDSGQITLSVFNDATQAVLGKPNVNPPPSPLVFSIYLVGLANATAVCLFTPQSLGIPHYPGASGGLPHIQVPPSRYRHAWSLVSKRCCRH